MTTDFDPEQVVRDVTANVRKKFPDHTDEQLESLVQELRLGTDATRNDAVTAITTGTL